MSKKIVSALVGVAAVFALTGVASAATNDQLIQQLMAQIQALQSQVLALQGGSSVTTTAGTTFTQDLTLGSRGAQVEALQQVLINGGYLNIAAPTGYFGSLTKSALAAWQKENGVSPSVGYFGPLTRAAMNAASATSGTSTTGGTTTGGTTTTTTTTTPTTSSAPSEGIMTVKLSATPSNGSSITTTSNTPVYGLDVTAQGSDMTVDRVTLQVAVTVGGTSQNPGNFINGISIVDGSGNLLVSKSVGSSDFVQDVNNNWYILISGIGLQVPKGTTKTMVVRFNTAGISSTDTARSVTISGYGTNSLRAVDTTGLSSYVDISSATLGSRTQSFSSSGAATLTTSADTNSPLSNNVQIPTSGNVNVTMQTFNVKSQTGPSAITTVGITVGASSTTALPSTLYLYDGSTLVGSVSAPTTIGGTATLTQLNIPVAQDQTKTLTIKADFPSTVTNGLAASTSIANLGSIVYQTSDGSTKNGGPAAAVAGNDMYFYSDIAQFNLSGTPAATLQTASVTSGTSTVKAVFTFNVTPVGGTLTLPVASDFTVVATGGTSTPGTFTPSTAVTVVPNQNISDGSSATVTVTSVLAAANAPVPVNNFYTFKISSIKWNVGTVGVTQTWGLTNDVAPAVYLQ